MTNAHHDDQNDYEKTRKIDALRDMINNAERTIQGAKAMLLQLEGKKKTGRKRKIESSEEGTVVEGTFDGQIMLGTDGKQYPVPANYASKSKLVEGDMLKLTITPEGSFVYKQIGPVERKHAIGIMSQDEKGNYYVFSEGKPFKVLLASITYFRAEPGDEIAITIPRDIDSSWAAIESVLQKGGFDASATHRPMPATETPSAPAAERNSYWKDLDKFDDEEIGSEKTPTVNSSSSDSSALADEWISDIEELEAEIRAEREKSI